MSNPGFLPDIDNAKGFDFDRCKGARERQIPFAVYSGLVKILQVWIGNDNCANAKHMERRKLSSREYPPRLQRTRTEI